MKNFRFALWGMVVVLYLLCSCSQGEDESANQTTIEEDVEDDEVGTDDETPGNEEEENPGAQQDPSLPDDEEEENPGDQQEPSLPDDEEEESEEPSIPSSPEEEEPDDDSECYYPEDSDGLVLQINELRTEYSRPRVEFIEIKILSAGNLGGVRVFAASNYKNPLIFEFDPLDVERGEYIVLHLRTLDEASSVNEYGDDLDESGGTDSSEHARDFWIPGNAKLLRKTDVVYVLDQDDNVLDAVLIAENPGSTWPTLSKQDCFPAVVEFLFGQDAWEASDGQMPVPDDAVSSVNTTATQTICRDETVKSTNSAADWYTTVKSGSTPGLKNNPNRL